MPQDPVYYYKHLSDLPPIPRDLLLATPLGECTRLTEDMGYGHRQLLSDGTELWPVTYIINTFTSPELVQWLAENVASSGHFRHVDLEPIKLQTQRPQANLTSSHPVHSDIGREWVLFYLIRPGGQGITTRWYREPGQAIRRAKSGADSQSDRGPVSYADLELLDSVELKPDNWYVLNVSVLHDVQGIQSLRQSLRLHCDPIDA